ELLELALERRGAAAVGRRGVPDPPAPARPAQAQQVLRQQVEQAEDEEDHGQDRDEEEHPRAQLPLDGGRPRRRRRRGRSVHSWFLAPSAPAVITGPPPRRRRRGTRRGLLSTGDAAWRETTVWSVSGAGIWPLFGTRERVGDGLDGHTVTPTDGDATEWQSGDGQRVR
uniref:Uncharacterized protein n=1 Tax=Zea mays TaxID=4577 RepID=A0A804R049_MAIZE